MEQNKNQKYLHTDHHILQVSKRLCSSVCLKTATLTPCFEPNYLPFLDKSCVHVGTHKVGENSTQRALLFYILHFLISSVL